MADRRIYELATKSAALGANDYFAVDNGTEAESKKLPTSYFTDQLADMQNVYGAKNLIPYPIDSFETFPKVTAGITFSDGGDGKIIANGTASGNGNFAVYFGTLKKGTYTLTGVTNIYNPNKVRCGIALSNWSTQYVEYGEGVTFTISDESIQYIIYVGILSGGTVTDEVFKPMLRLASIQDDTYVPYVPINKDLVSYKVNGELGAKNLLPYPYAQTTKVENGITYTDVGDGNVTVSGTATSDTTFYCCNTNIGAILGEGVYRLSGCPTGGDRSSGYFLEIVGRSTSSDTWTVLATDIEEGASFAITNAMLSWGVIHVFIRIRKDKAITSPITFKPMIRKIEDTDTTYQPYAKTNKELTDAFKNQVANKADEYSSSKAYAVGDRCIYNNVLYKCITACSAAAWSVNQTNFEATTLAESVGELNSALMQLKNYVYESNITESLTSALSRADSFILGLSVEDRTRLACVARTESGNVYTFYTSFINGNTYYFTRIWNNATYGLYKDSSNNYYGIGYYINSSNPSFTHNPTITYFKLFIA